MASDITYYVWSGPAGVYASYTRPAQQADDDLETRRKAGDWIGAFDALVLNPDAFAVLFGMVPLPGRLYRVTARWECDVTEEADAPVCVGGA